MSPRACARNHACQLTSYACTKKSTRRRRKHMNKLTQLPNTSSSSIDGTTMHGRARSRRRGRITVRRTSGSVIAAFERHLLVRKGQSRRIHANETCKTHQKKRGEDLSPRSPSVESFHLLSRRKRSGRFALSIRRCFVRQYEVRRSKFSRIAPASASARKDNARAPSTHACCTKMLVS